MDVESRISRAKPLVSGIQDKLYNLKWETANELSVNIPNKDYWGDVPSRECGRVGGNMVRKLIALGKQQL